MKTYAHLEAQVASVCFSGLLLTRSQPMVAELGSVATSVAMALRATGGRSSVARIPAKSCTRQETNAARAPPRLDNSWGTRASLVLLDLLLELGQGRVCPVAVGLLDALCLEERLRVGCKGIREPVE